MSLDWARLRPWSGSREHAFEELCAQLAASESAPADSRFFRKGAPDAGVECFWQLPNGDEWAWQAKFFLTSPNSGQWNQINDSVLTAIEKHPLLRKYVVCLPIDLPDARHAKGNSAREKWCAYVAKWEKLAAKKGTSVAFELWGQSEIGGRLNDDKHRGRKWFWFQGEHFGTEWFERRIDEAIANARDRYSPELNVDLPIRATFDAFGRTPEFFSRVADLYSKTMVTFKKLRPHKVPAPLKDELAQIESITREVFARIEPWISTDSHYLEFGATRAIPWRDIGWLTRQLLECVRRYHSAIYDERDRATKNPELPHSWDRDDLSIHLHRVHGFELAVAQLDGFAADAECRLSNSSALLLVGTAGQGKTHLFCDVAKRDTAARRPRLLLHGEHFHNAEPWSQIIALLGLNCSQDEFIGGLEAAAQASNSQLLILIDALNEGEGNRLWCKFLPGMITTIERSPWLRLCVSVRSAYEDLVIPQALNDNRIVRVEHGGFGELADDACSIFFAHFGIEPSTPLLSPEFANPLFLKLFCQSLHNSGMKRVPSGMRGITAIFQFFIDSVDKKLSHSELLDYDPRSGVVNRAVEQLATVMAKRKTDRLPLDEAKSLVNAQLPRESYERSLFRHLEAESVLTVVPDKWAEDGKWSELVRFTFQRFSDHLIVQRLLDRYLDRKRPRESFSRRRTLGRLVKDEQACWVNWGFLEALAVQIPELTKRELPDLVPHVSGCHPMRAAFVNSIVWRDPQSFGPSSNRYINNEVVRFTETFHAFLEALITLAVTPRHPLNADQLHAHLTRFEMADRDAWWATFLNDQWIPHSVIDRLIEWAWRDDDKSEYDNEVIRLAGLTLAWFCSCANRTLRDQSTKALVRLCENRLEVLQQIINTLRNVNDVYVRERLCAVSYGCAMRTGDTAALGELAHDVYKWVFESRRPPPHILLRDYARGVIECALHRGCHLDVDISRVRPPYHSEWPALDVPERKRLESWRECAAPGEWAKARLYDSVMGNGDFSRYVIGDLRGWSSHALTEPDEPTLKDVHDEFVKSLTARQRQAWDVLCTVTSNVRMCRQLDEDEQKKLLGREISMDELEVLERAAKRGVERTLRRNSKKARKFDAALEYVADPSTDQKKGRFDGDLARRWMMQRIIDIGWTVERFGTFDENVTRYSATGRQRARCERIGKKYQWIAYHELLARLSDNFKMHEDVWSTTVGRFQGPWDYPFRRDIDPSNLLRETKQDEWHAQTNTWWSPSTFTEWNDPADEVKWLKRHDNLPCTVAQIVVAKGGCDTSWLTLHGYYDWREPIPVGEEPYEQKRRHLWYMLNAYLVREADSAKVLAWARRQNWMGRWMPESQESYSVFLGEYFWSPVFKAQDCPYYGRQGWTRDTDRGMGRIPVDVLVANDEYARESGSDDCSINETMFIDVPCRFLVESLELEWRGVEGSWFDKGGRLIAFDPSVNARGPRVLLFRRDVLVKWLNANGLTVLWTLLGEKETVGGPMDDRSYFGRTEMNGAYLLKGDVVDGGMRADFVPR